MTLPMTPREAAEAEAIAQLYVVERLSCREIARRLGIHPVTVRLRLDRLGIARDRGRHRRTPRAVQDQIATLTAAGLTQREIAAKVGCCHVTVGAWQPRLAVWSTVTPERPEGRDGH